jgi:sugar (pentulose or hexulose) kinase
MLETTLVAVDLDTWGHDLVLSDDHQQPRRPAVSKHKHGTYPAGDELQLYGSGSREGALLLVIDEGALPSATTSRYRLPRGCLRWLLL